MATITVCKCLMWSTKLENLTSLLNRARFRARHPDLKTFYGTTANEAFHMQFKAYFRNVFFQTGRNAKLVCKAITIAKLLVAKLKKDLPHHRAREHDLLQLAVQRFANSDAVFAPALDNRVRQNPVVDIELLPRSAKRLRKRPAFQEPQ